MSHLMPRLARRGAGLGVACALAGAALVVPAVPASADAAITADEQTFYGYYRLDAIHSSGYTGDGVTIALIDGPVNTQIPELAGARIQSYSPCTVGSQDKFWDHGTVIAQVISSPQFGVAPARIYAPTHCRSLVTRRVPTVRSDSGGEATPISLSSSRTR